MTGKDTMTSRQRLALLEADKEILIQDTWDITVIWLLYVAVLVGLFFWLTG